MRISDWSSDVCSSDLDAASAGFEADDIFAAAQGELAKADLLGPAQRLAEHDERFLGEVVGGNDIIGPFVIKDVDLVVIDELGELDGLLSLQLAAPDLLLEIGRASCRGRVFHSG